MISRVNHSNPASGNSTMRLVEPSESLIKVGDARCEVTSENGTPVIVFADPTRIMNSARRMKTIHQETFRKLAE